MPATEMSICSLLMPGSSISTFSASLLLPDVDGRLVAEDAGQEAVGRRAEKARQQPIDLVAELMKRVSRGLIAKDHGKPSFSCQNFLKLI